MKESIVLMDTENPDIYLPHMYSLSQYYLRKCWYAHTISIKEVWWEWNMGVQNSQRVLLSLLLLLFHCSKNIELLEARLIQDFPWGHDMSLKQGTHLAGLALAWSQGLNWVFWVFFPLKPWSMEKEQGSLSKMGNRASNALDPGPWRSCDFILRTQLFYPEGLWLPVPSICVLNAVILNKLVWHKTWIVQDPFSIFFIFSFP